ncbi:MAG: hypothetical protein RSE36_04300 [Oscillospiraceae bacterium]
MNEWGVVGVIVSLVGLFAVIVPPIVKLINSITKLTVIVEKLGGDITELTENNARSHDRLWRHNENQDKSINDHEKRLVKLEK